MNPNPFLIIRNTFPTLYTYFFIFSHLKIQKYKNTFISCIHNIKPKNIIHYCFHHPCIFIYHHLHIKLFSGVVQIERSIPLVPHTTLFSSIVALPSISLHIYFLFAFIIFSHICSHLVLDNHLVRLRV